MGNTVPSTSVNVQQDIVSYLQELPNSLSLVTTTNNNTNNNINI